MSGPPALLILSVAAIALSLLAIATGVVVVLVVVRKRRNANATVLPIAAPRFQLVEDANLNAVRASQETCASPPKCPKEEPKLPASPDYNFSQFSGQYTIASSTTASTLNHSDEPLEHPHPPFRDIKLIPTEGRRRNSSSCFSWTESQVSDTSSLTTFAMDDEQEGACSYDKTDHDAPFNIFKKKGQLSPIRLMAEEDQFPQSVPLSRRRRQTPLDFTLPNPRFVKVDLPLHDGIVLDFSDPTMNEVVTSLLDTSTPPSSPGSDPFASMQQESPTPLPRKPRNRKNLGLDLVKPDMDHLVRYGDDGIIILSKQPQSPIITSPISPIPSAHRPKKVDRYDLMLDFLGSYE